MRTEVGATRERIRQQALIAAINTIQPSEAARSPFRRSTVRREGWEAARKAGSLHRRRGSDGR